MIQTIISVFVFVAFVYILANRKIPSALIFFSITPFLVLFHVLEASTVWGFFGNTGMLLLMIINCYAGLMTISGFDELIGEAFECMTKGIGGKNRERNLFAVIFVLTAICSMFMANSSVCMALVPALYGISRKMNISRSKLILFVVYSSTLGGACTLIGTDTNIFANAALEEAGLQTFGMFDFAWVALPIAVIGAIYMILFHRNCQSYDDQHDEDDMVISAEHTEEEMVFIRKQRKGVAMGFFSFIIILLLNSFDFFKSLDINPYAWGFLTLGLLYMAKCFTWKQIMSSFSIERLFNGIGLLAVIKMLTSSSLGDIIGAALENAIGTSTNMYFIFTVLFIVTAIITQFMNNMTACGVIAPIAIALSQSIGADPRALVMAIAIAAGCGYLTPFASGTNQRMSLFSKSTLLDYMKFGWPLMIITYICAVLILPHVFPFF